MGGLRVSLFLFIWQELLTVTNFACGALTSLSPTFTLSHCCNFGQTLYSPSYMSMCLYLSSVIDFVTPISRLVGTMLNGTDTPFLLLVLSLLSCGALGTWGWWINQRYEQFSFHQDCFTEILHFE
jgi:hypothetical protein